ncbi:MAG: 50S ribosomal protein L28 [Clostridia bacterium]|nr:50S ribosomal protein L28 [Clostridia bacterium]
MSRVCSVCGKGKLSGNLVSHSNRKTPRLYNANVQKVKIVKDGAISTEYVCTRCLKKSEKVGRV